MTNNLLNLISTVAFFAVGFGLLRWINHFEPQWVSRDGSRFSARITEDRVDTSKWVEVRVAIDGRQLIVHGRGRRAKWFRGRWNVRYFTETPDQKRRHYVLSKDSESNDRAILRVPATSRCVATLDALTR